MIRDNLAEVRKEIREEEEKSGRKEGSVLLMAVSKLHTWENIMEAYEAGQRLFGENHVQEIEKKFPLRRPLGMELHLIGHLQGNKVKKVVPLVDSIDSVDSLKLLKEIDNACTPLGKVMPTLLEVNTSGEEAKSGFLDEDSLFHAVEESCSLSHVSVNGLMTVGPLGGDGMLIRKAFHMLVSLQKKLQDKFPLPFSVLSMGMSGDFPIAVDEGSTMVRVGTRIFGERNYDL